MAMISSFERLYKIARMKMRAVVKIKFFFMISISVKNVTKNYG
jgi:hypothetical protein